MKGFIMNLEQLNQLKSNIVSGLLEKLAPKMNSSNGSNVKSLVLANSINLDESRLSPIYGVSTEGIILNCYGNASTRKWAEVGIEDVIRLEAALINPQA